MGGKFVVAPFIFMRLLFLLFYLQLQLQYPSVSPQNMAATVPILIIIIFLLGRVCRGATALTPVGLGNSSVVGGGGGRGEWLVGADITTTSDLEEEFLMDSEINRRMLTGDQHITDRSKDPHKAAGQGCGSGKPYVPCFGKGNPDKKPKQKCGMYTRPQC